jgi:hypothetical protein
MAAYNGSVRVFVSLPVVLSVLTLAACGGSGTDSHAAPAEWMSVTGRHWCTRVDERWLSHSTIERTGHSPSHCDD